MLTCAIPGECTAGKRHVGAVAGADFDCRSRRAHAVDSQRRTRLPGVSAMVRDSRDDAIHVAAQMCDSEVLRDRSNLLHLNASTFRQRALPPESHPFACRSVTTTSVPESSSKQIARCGKRRPVICRAEAGTHGVDCGAAVLVEDVGWTTTAALSANVRTATSPAARDRIAWRARRRASVNCAGADMLSDVSIATTVNRPLPADAARKNGRANASASSTSAADAQREEQPLAQPAVRRMLDRRVLQQRDRGEPDAMCGAPLQQMQDDRHNRGRARPRETAATGTTSGGPRSRGQIREQRHLERLAGVEQLIVDAGGAKLAPIAIDQRANLLQIVLAHGAGTATTSSPDSRSSNRVAPSNGKLELVAIEHMEHEHVGTAILKVLQSRE